MASLSWRVYGTMRVLAVMAAVLAGALVGAVDAENLMGSAMKPPQARYATPRNEQVRDEHNLDLPAACAVSWVARTLAQHSSEVPPHCTFTSVAAGLTGGCLCTENCAGGDHDSACPPTERPEDGEWTRASRCSAVEPSVVPHTFMS